MRKFVCMSGSAGDTAAAGLAKERADEVGKRLPAFFLRRLTAVCEQDAAFAEAHREKEDEAYAAVRCSRGVLAALWELGEAAATGFEIEYGAIPVRQETIELCECLGIDPYELPSSGTVYLCSEPEDGECVIGHTTDAAARVIRMKSGIRYLNRS